MNEALQRLYDVLPRGAYANINYGRTTRGHPSKVHASVNFPEKLPIYVHGDTIVTAVNALIKAIEERA